MDFYANNNGLGSGNGTLGNGTLGNGVVLNSYLATNVPTSPPTDYMVHSPILSNGASGIVNIPYSSLPPPTSHSGNFNNTFGSPYTSANNIHSNQLPNPNGFQQNNNNNNVVPSPMSPMSPTGVDSPTPQARAPSTPAAVAEVTSQILQGISNAVSNQQVRLANILKQQLSVIEHQIHLTNQAQLWSLANEEEQLYSQIDAQIRALSALPTQAMLTPTDMFKVRQLQVDLRKQLKQLELYREELRHVQENTTPTAPLAALTIVKQPFPQVIRKTQQLSEDQLTVQLLTGAYNDLSVLRAYNDVGLPHITATLLLDNGPAGNISFLECNTQPVDLASGIARFPLRFPVGTRKSVVHIKFQMPLGAGPSAPTVESEMSDPLIIITNECQWEGSLGTLIKKHAFGGKLEIPWPLFANTLQHYFLIATRQDLGHPKRPLSTFDFDYLHKKFFGYRASVTQTSFDKFWEWFGKIVHTLRFTRHVCSLWQAGIIYGFLDRQAVTDVLVSNNQPIGTFIIRFSERYAGQFDIVWVGHTEINHYLVKHDDIANPRKTLPDFIAMQTQFLHLLQLTTGEDGVPGFVQVPKDVAIQQFIVPRDPPRRQNNEDGPDYLEQVELGK